MRGAHTRVENVCTRTLGRGFSLFIVNIRPGLFNRPRSAVERRRIARIVSRGCQLRPCFFDKFDDVMDLTTMNVGASVECPELERALAPAGPYERHRTHRRARWRIISACVRSVCRGRGGCSGARWYASRRAFTVSIRVTVPSCSRQALGCINTRCPLAGTRRQGRRSCCGKGR